MTPSTWTPKAVLLAGARDGFARKRRRLIRFLSSMISVHQFSEEVALFAELVDAPRDKQSSDGGWCNQM